LRGNYWTISTFKLGT